MEPRPAIEDGLTLWRRNQFLAAHECFETAWRRAEGQKKTVLHALAQLSAGHHQLSLGRARAAVNTWRKAEHKLQSIDALAESFASELSLFCQRHDLSIEGPRRIDVGKLPAHETWPFPDAIQIALLLR